MMTLGSSERPQRRQEETEELVRRLQAARRRRRRLQAGIGLVGGVVLIAAVTTVALAAGGAFEPRPPATTMTVGSEAGGGSSTSLIDSTTIRVPTTHATVSTTRRISTTLPSTTTSMAPTTTATAVAPTSTTVKARGKIVVIDPGHQAHGDSSLEPIGPGSNEKKPKVSEGTAGVVTGIPESELVLALGLQLRDALQAKGIKVVMTRTSEQVNLSNIERARIANEAHADLFVRLHADGNDNKSARGIHVLYPAVRSGWTDDIAEASKVAASLAQHELIRATGAVDLGIDARGDLTGFNWSDVPVMLPELGFMTNPAEDQLLATQAYRDKIVQALTRAIEAYLSR